MRNLTILREKSFVGCAASLKVYIEDPINQELVIQGTPCRKLGTLKNGEQKTFQIDDTGAKIYVIADKLSKNFTNEFFEIPAGTEDISLSGKNHYNPFAGNPFYFNGNTNASALENRKQSKKKSMIVVVAAVAIGLAIGFLGNSGGKGNTEPKVFTEKGMTITLPGEFKKFNAEGYTVGYTTNKAAVFALKEEFSLFVGADNLTLQEYGQLVLDNNGMTEDIQLMEHEGLTLFEYQVDNFYYLACVYKSHDAFWLVQFSCDESDADTYVNDFVAWAKTVKFQ